MHLSMFCRMQACINFEDDNMMNNLFNVNFKRRIIVYGTGINAKNFVTEYRGSLEIICCLDKWRRSGIFEDIPISDWESIDIGDADCVVILSITATGIS